MKNIGKTFFLFLAGGLMYLGIETLWRGYSHWSMFLLGGACFVLCGLLNEGFPWQMPLLLQMLAGSVLITMLEFLTGCVVNLWLGWNVWDYTRLRFQLLGQISLKFSLVWFVLSGIAIFLDDWIRYLFFSEEKPRYRLW